jgi:hypothetical protein
MRRVAKRAPCLIVVLAFFTFPVYGTAEEATVAFSVATGGSGGASVVRVDIDSGQILAVDRLFASPDCKEPFKIRRSANGKTVAVTNVKKKGPHLFVWSADTPDDPIGLDLDSIPDELRLARGLALLTMAGDAIAVVDIANGQIEKIQELDEIVTPPANAPEDLIVDAAQQHVVVSVQKDGSGGKKKGSRLLVFDLPNVELIADLPLPRQHPELHIADNPTEQGPGPEVLHISPQTDTLAVTLDLYGGVGMMRWSAAQVGRMDADDWTLVSTSPSGKLDGLAFPDRAAAMSLDGRELFLVCNAGEEGGSVLLDLAQRQVIWRGTTPAGLEKPIYIPSLRRALTVCSGKTKRRVGDDVVKEFHPQQSLIVFEFPERLEGAHQTASTPVVRVSQLPLGAFTTQISLASIDPPWLVVAVGDRPNRADTLLTIDAASGKIKDRHPAGGIVGRFDQ